MATEETREVLMAKRSRATGGKLLLPGKKYTVSKSDFLDLVRCGKGKDPTGKLKVERPPMDSRDTGEEHPGGRGESSQTPGTRTVSGGATEAKGKDEEKAAAKK